VLSTADTIASPPASSEPLATVGLRSDFDFHREVSPLLQLLLGVAGGISFLLLWQVAALAYGKTQLWPPPTGVAVALYELVVEQAFLADVWASLRRVLVSFAIAAVIALPLGLFMGAFAPLRAFGGPLLAAFRYLPATAFVPLFLMWLGAGEEQKLALLTVGVVFFLITLIIDNTLAVRADLIDTARTLGLSRSKILWSVVLPASLPAYVDTLRQMLAVGWTYLVVAEIVATTDGIGAMMMRAKRFVHVDEIMAGIVVIGALGLVLDGLCRVLHRYAFPYLYPGR
jgi:NitT/TauT family transport system permease protein